MTNYHTPDPETWDTIHRKAWQLVDDADKAGIVLEISSAPFKPLAMGNTLMWVHTHPARITQPPPMSTQDMACDAMLRVFQSIDESYALHSHEVSLGFDDAFHDANIRTSRAATQAMLLQGRSWRVGPFCRDGWAA